MELNKETKRPWYIIGREAGDWQEDAWRAKRAEEERVNACREQRSGRGGLGGGEENEQRNRKADVEEVGN